MNPKVTRFSLHHFFIRAVAGPQQSESPNPRSNADTTNNLWQQIHRSSISTRALCLQQCCRAAQPAPHCAQTYREAEELIELGQQHVPILHLAARVADGVDGHQQEPRQGPQRRQLLLPRAAHVPQLVKKAALQRLPIQHCQHRGKTVSALAHLPTLLHLLACLSFEFLSLSSTLPLQALQQLK